MIQKVYTNPDIYRIQVELPDNPLQYLNSYVIKGETRNLVIDTGFNQPACRESLCAGLNALDIDLQQTDLFLIYTCIYRYFNKLWITCRLQLSTFLIDLCTLCVYFYIVKL